ncbi:MAG: YbbR-like domain-containing protein [Gemmatimonadota bacterium]|nr:MAG: YbbR-like domain-containing protein [Gemmatimonadota bacterium]
MADFRTTLRRNWLYMLTGTLLSVFLWVAVSADTVAQQTISADLLIANRDRQYVLTEREPAIDAVSVVFTGRAGDLATLLVSRPQVFVPIDSVESPLWDITLTPQMVKGRGGRELVDVRAVSVRPDQIRLHFQPRARKVVPVVPQLRVSLADGYVFADSLRTEPGSVTVEGPEPSVSRVDSVMTLPIERMGLRESVSVEIPLENPNADSLLELSWPTVRVTLSVEPRLERVFPGLPVSVSGAGAGAVRVEPSLVDVRLSGPRSAVEAVRAEALLPRVELSGPGDFGSLLPVRLPAPAPFVEVAVDPDSARVLLAAGTS